MNDPSLAPFDRTKFAGLACAMGRRGHASKTRVSLGGMREFIRQRSRAGPILIDIKLDPTTMPNTF